MLSFDTSLQMYWKYEFLVEQLINSLLYTFKDKAQTALFKDPVRTTQ